MPSVKASINVLEPNTKLKIDFPGYSQKGNMLSIKTDKEKYLVDGLPVNTYFDRPDDKINFEVNYASLRNGVQYAGETILNPRAKLWRS
jgi:hypothetical protein